MRAPGRKKGGKVHGQKPKNCRYPFLKKMRLLGIKIFFLTIKKL